MLSSRFLLECLLCSLRNTSKLVANFDEIFVYAIEQVDLRYFDVSPRKKDKLQLRKRNIMNRLNYLDNLFF